MIIIYTTCASEAEAETIAKALLDEKLIACANWWPVRSAYNWRGKRQNENEIALILKTDESQAEAVSEKIKELHSYDTPCIARIEVAKINQEYERWLFSECFPKASPQS